LSYASDEPRNREAGPALAFKPSIAVSGFRHATATAPDFSSEKLTL